MNPTETITEDGEVITTALVPQQTQPPAQRPPEQTVAQARVDSVAKILDAAYQRASLLELTDEEAKALIAPFPDDAVRTGAGGDDKLLYLEHASVRRRLLEVFGPGRWVPVCRRLWTEDYLTAKNEPAVRVYTDVVLLIRGCYVGEAIGCGSYFPKNPKQDLSSAAESAQSEALRRICGKNLGVGLHLWNKAWCEDWKARQRNRGREPAEQEQPPKPNGPTEAELREKGLAILKVAAPEGTAALASAWKTLTHAMQTLCLPDKEKFKAQALKADAAKQALKDAGLASASELAEFHDLMHRTKTSWAVLRDAPALVGHDLAGVSDAKEMTAGQIAAVLGVLRQAAAEPEKEESPEDADVWEG